MEDDDSDAYMEIDGDDVVIEEVETEDLLEDEISQFRMITPNESTVTCDPNLTRSSVIASTSSYIDAEDPILPEHEEILIKKLINGEIAFSDYNAQIGNILDDVIIDEPDEIVEESNSEPVKSTSTDSNNDFTNELFQSRRDAFRGNLTGRSMNKETGKFTRRRCMLPTALQGLMGEANLCYARGQTELAEKLCFEIIRQVPLNHEPFLTLAQIHENNSEKYMQFSLIAAHLNPSDMEQWIRIAQLAMEQGVYCSVDCADFTAQIIQFFFYRQCETGHQLLCQSK